jgi:hypothetical protein
MPVTADSYEAKAIEIAADMLARSASFRAAVGVPGSDATAIAAAKAFIVESHSGAEVDGETGIGKAMDGSDLDLSVAPYAVIGLDPGLDVDAGAVGYPDYTVGVLARLVLALAAAGLTPAENTRAAWNLTGAIRAEMQAQVGGGTAFADAEVSSAGLAIGEQGVHRDHIVAQLTITARG